jgi:hypothetical protein
VGKPNSDYEKETSGRKAKIFCEIEVLQSGLAARFEIFGPRNLSPLHCSKIWPQARFFTSKLSREPK